LGDVPAAAIAAALPRLHTLHLNETFDVDFPVAAFYDELLPRLRSFRLEGKWPPPSHGTGTADVSALPLLEDLKWHSTVSLPRQFMVARPSMLHAHSADLIRWLRLTADGAGAASSPVTVPLERVRALEIRFGGPPQKSAATARLLRAAPHLRQLTLDVTLDEPVRNFLLDAFTAELAHTEVLHPTLRHVIVTGMYPPHNALVPKECGVRLRQHHFPCLRRLTVNIEEYPVWLPRWPRRKLS
jgi:hypothetical protein